MWYVVALIWIALVAGIFWAYNRRRRAAVSTRTKELSALLLEAQTAKKAVAAAVAAPAAGEVINPAATTVTSYARRPKLLGKSDGWLYLLFRAGLPDHEVFANVALADVVEPAASLRGYDREQAARRLAQSIINVVVCNRQLEVVAAVMYPASEPAREEAQRFAEFCLRAAGIRIVQIDPAALPRHHQIRALVYGDTPSASGA